MSGELQLYEGAPPPLTAQAVRQQINLIQEIMRDAMKENEHYGKIPGCGKKPSLLKAGAEKLNLTFRMAPKYQITSRELHNGHREYEVITTLLTIESGKFLGEGVGSCSTLESKYRFRKAEQKCPKCGQETIIKGKQEYGGGWLCYRKNGGCGAKFADGDPEIENQEMGRVEYDNPADYYNTVLKMAKKRSLVDAVLTVTAASDIFTQDIEDFADNGIIEVKGTVVKEPTPKQPPAGPKPKMIDDDTLATIETLASDTGTPLVDILNAYKVESLKDLTAAQAQRVVDRLIAKKDSA